jgi:hypothetical protein
MLFWEQEEKKYKFFCIKNEDFINYYKSGQTNNDKRYFMRENNYCKYIPVTHVYDVDKNYRSPYGHLIGMYIGHKLYNDYVKDRLDSLRFLLAPPTTSFPEAVKMQFKKNLFKNPATGISIILHKLTDVVGWIRNPSLVSRQQEKRRSSDFGDMHEEMYPDF